MAATTFPAGVQVPINDKRYYPLYAKCVELDIPIFVCAGVPGPRVPMAPQKVELIDEVCWFFPELTFVMRHGAEPWTELAVKLMLKWPNLYYSTSAFAPKHYPKAIIDYANTRGADKVIYAGYFPAGLTYDRIFADLPDGAVQRRRLAEVPARQRAAGVEARRMTSFYGETHRPLQDRFDSRTLADTLEAVIVQPVIDDEAKAFIESRSFFFLSTVNARRPPHGVAQGRRPRVRPGARPDHARVPQLRRQRHVPVDGQHRRRRPRRPAVHRLRDAPPGAGPRHRHGPQRRPAAWPSTRVRTWWCGPR